MHRHSIDCLRPKKLSTVFRPFFPGRVIRKPGDHFHLVSSLIQEFTKRDIMRRDSRKLRRVVDSPDDGAHLFCEIFDLKPTRRVSLLPRRNPKLCRCSKNATRRGSHRCSGASVKRPVRCIARQNKALHRSATTSARRLSAKTRHICHGFHLHETASDRVPDSSCVSS